MSEEKIGISRECFTRFRLFKVAHLTNEDLDLDLDLDLNLVMRFFS